MFKSLRGRVLPRITPVLLAIGLTLSISGAGLVAAAVNNPTPQAKISFTFDDGLDSAYTTVAPLLKKYGLTATDYVITSCVGMTKIPNTCHANNDLKYMTWQQIGQLRSTYGWEIGSHTATHPYLATKDANDGQPKVLTPAQVTKELSDSKQALASHGIDAKSFSSPYGDYNNAVLKQIARYYQSHRGFADNANNNWPNNDYLLYDMQVQAGVTVAQVKTRIDQAIANKQWLILTMHEVKAKASSNPDDYQYNTSQLDQIASYVSSKQKSGLVKSINVSDGLVTSDTNLLANGSFNDGIADGWQTDNAKAIVRDSSSNGSYPDPTNSIRFSSAAGSTPHLFSPKVSVSSANNYVIKTYLDLEKITSGNVGIYIDEYDANGNWISGQYKVTESSAFVEDLNIAYKPSSPAVAQASYQFIVGGSGISGYLDNIQWFRTDAAPVSPNLLTNGNFDSGIADGWRTDSQTTVSADSANNGAPDDIASQLKSVHLTGLSDRQGHLFAPAVPVTSGSNYSIFSYLDLRAITNGEIGFYIDEYDANGNWISGQYKTGIRSTYKGNVGLTYTASSANVKTASLQIIITADPSINAYIDNIRWLSAN